MTTFTWLHLSDFHFKKDENWQRDVVLETLMRDVIGKLAEFELKPDAVFVTGDIAHSGKDAEYRQARLFFDEAVTRLNHQPTKTWFLVPGNHDVDRNLLSVMQKKNRNHLSDLETANDILSDPNSRADFAARQKDFLRFTGDFLGPRRAWDAKTPWRTDKLTKDGLEIAVLCLNSAWAAQDDDDKGRLMIGEFQVRNALKQAEKAQLRIGLFHHPWDWLCEFDRNKARDILTGSNGCHLLLRGHLHETELSLLARPGFQTAELAAGACWQGARWPHSVTVGRLDFDARKMHLHIFSYSEKEGGFWAKDTALSRSMPDGVWSVDFPKQWAFKLKDAAAVEKTGISDEEWIPESYRKELERTCGRHENLIDAERPLVCRLRDVYVPLKTAWLEPDKRRNQEAASKEEVREEQETRRELTDLIDHPQYRHFLIVGGPGTGKSTFTRYAALNTLDADSGWLPLHLQLKDFGSWLEDHKGKQPDLLCRWAAEQLASYDLSNLAERLGKGRVIWLLDGLDEIFNQSIRLRAAAIIGAFTRRKGYDQDRLIITSRPHALAQSGLGKALDLEETTAHIQALDGADQRRFLLMWFNALYDGSGGGAETSRDDLWQNMNRNANLNDLRSTPLLLSMIATLYHLGKKLPKRRADLYEKAVWNLLQRRYGPHGRENGSDQLVFEMRQALMKVARWMQSKGAVRDISKRDLLHILDESETPGWREWAKAEEIAVDLGAHSGLLTMKNHRFSFVHLGFQEFLAARSIALAKQPPTAALRKHFFDGAWKEVILLTAGHLFEIGVIHLAESIIEGLLSTKGKTHCRSLALAVEAAAQAPKGVLGSLENDLKQRSLAIIQDKTNKDAEKDRFELGLALGYLGDPRLGLEKKENWVSVDKTFMLSRFPVTNHDFKAFIDAGGYHNAQWWDEKGLAWLEAEIPDEENRYPLYWWDKDWNVPNQPVVGVNFYEARAFCRWLTAKLDAGNYPWLPGGYEVRLPNGEEWGLAAAEGKQEYPWGDEDPDETRANYDYRLERTSPVGLYPNGAAGDLLDLAGNMLEWTLELDSDEFLSLRGGSWFSPSRLLASSYRLGSRAGLRLRDLGFRCCLAPRALDG
ncbi:MAG: SUMF1/EgtB/PvdO family nonheme iron enzyme [Acidobacteriota bacterium]|nr:SUMF1/EgtB/PvdO family nonheme iron enzyme [Acidobacteriota bacterium]